MTPARRHGGVSFHAGCTVRHGLTITVLWVRRLFLFLGLFLAVTPATVLLAASPAQAACAPPSVSVEPGSGAAGQAVLVTGSHYANCVDTVVCVVGQPCPPQAPADPMRGVVVRFVQGSTTVNLATVDAAADGTFRVTVTLPAEARPGSATLGTPSVTVPFTVATGSTSPRAATAVPVRSGTPTRASTLPATGIAAATNAGFGVGLLSAGVFLLAVSAARRDRRTA